MVRKRTIVNVVGRDAHPKSHSSVGAIGMNQSPPAGFKKNMNPRLPTTHRDYNARKFAVTDGIITHAL